MNEMSMKKLFDGKVFRKIAQLSSIVLGVFSLSFLPFVYHIPQASYKKLLTILYLFVNVQFFRYCLDYFHLKEVYAMHIGLQMCGLSTTLLTKLYLYLVSAFDVVQVRCNLHYMVIFCSSKTQYHSFRFNDWGVSARILTLHSP